MEDRVAAAKLLKNYLSASTGRSHDSDRALSRRTPDTATPEKGMLKPSTRTCARPC